MSTNLAARAAALANQNGAPSQQAPARTPVPTPPPDAALSDTGIPEVDVYAAPDQIPAHVAWIRVMRDVRGIGKNQKVTEGPAKFNYRGVDDAMDRYGPACRQHGVFVMPVKVDATYRDTKTSTGKNTRECTVKVGYRIYGPMGDWIPAEAAGESLDSGDKGTAKAQAVALRTLLLHGGMVPTGDPDPDSQNVERGEAQVRPPASYRDEILHPGTTQQRMLQIRYELGQLQMIGAVVANETGQDEPLGQMVNRVGRERFAPKPAPQPAHPEGFDPELGVVVPPNAGVPTDGLFGQDGQS